jgi:hypothetical protein
LDFQLTIDKEEDNTALQRDHVPILYSEMTNGKETYQELWKQQSEPEKHIQITQSFELHT